MRSLLHAIRSLIQPKVFAIVKKAPSKEKVVEFQVCVELRRIRLKNSHRPRAPRANIKLIAVNFSINPGSGKVIELQRSECEAHLDRGCAIASKYVSKELT